MYLGNMFKSYALTSGAGVHALIYTFNTTFGLISDQIAKPIIIIFVCNWLLAARGQHILLIGMFNHANMG